MRKAQYAKMPIDGLLDLYASAATLYGSATTKEDYRSANKQARILLAACIELRSRGSDAQQLLLKLLKHTEKWVRGWAASHVLEFAPEEGLPVLEELATDPGLVGLDARIVLQEWRKGTLKFP